MSTDFTKYSQQYVFCDETGMGGDRHYGFGALFMDYNRRGAFQREWAEVAEAAPFGDEIKWTGTNDRKLDFYMQVVDFFFRRPWMRFHCIRVRRSRVDKEIHDGDFALGERKHYTMFLANKLDWLSGEASRHVFRVKADELPYGYEKADEAMETVGGYMFEQASDADYELKVSEVDSKKWTGVQLCDLLLGAALAPVQRDELSGPKRLLNRYIAAKLGPKWDTLCFDTYPSAWKFNIWHWKPETGNRQCETRRVWDRWRAGGR